MCVCLWKTRPGGNKPCRSENKPILLHLFQKLMVQKHTHKYTLHHEGQRSNKVPRNVERGLATKIHQGSGGAGPLRLVGQSRGNTGPGESGTSRNSPELTCTGWPPSDHKMLVSVYFHQKKRHSRVLSREATYQICFRKKRQ